jgi:MOSC domain-containing protein YiiM
VRDLAELTATVPQVGRVERILLRPARRETPVDVVATTASTGRGLDGDRRATSAPVRRPSRRQVTLVQAEHLAVVAALLGREAPLDAALLRRNVVVSGLPLLALKGLRFRLGAALLEGTGPCHPCSRMEEALGPGGYQAMRGHGGITAIVLEDGDVAVGAPVAVVPA